MNLRWLEALARRVGACHVCNVVTFLVETLKADVTFSGRMSGKAMWVAGEAELDTLRLEGWHFTQAISTRIRRAGEDCGGSCCPLTSSRFLLYASLRQGPLFSWLE